MSNNDVLPDWVDPPPSSSSQQQQQQTGTTPAWAASNTNTYTSGTAPSNNSNDVLPDWATDGPPQHQVVDIAVDDLPESAPPKINGIVLGNGNSTTAPQDDNKNNNTTTSSTNYERKGCWEFMRRDWRLLLITIGIIIVMNIPFVKWVMYVFFFAINIVAVVMFFFFFFLKCF